MHSGAHQGGARCCAAPWWLTAQARKAGQEANARIAAERASVVGPVITELQAAGASSLRGIATILLRFLALGDAFYSVPRHPVLTLASNERPSNKDAVCTSRQSQPEPPLQII